MSEDLKTALRAERQKTAVRVRRRPRLLLEVRQHSIKQLSGQTSNSKAVKIMKQLIFLLLWISLQLFCWVFSAFS